MYIILKLMHKNKIKENNFLFIWFYVIKLTTDTNFNYGNCFF